MKRFTWFCMLLAVSVFSVATLGCGPAEEPTPPAEGTKVEPGTETKMEETTPEPGETGETGTEPAEAATEPAGEPAGEPEKKEDGSAAADPASGLNIDLDVNVDKTSDQPGA